MRAKHCSARLLAYSNQRVIFCSESVPKSDQENWSVPKAFRKITEKLRCTESVPKAFQKRTESVPKAFQKRVGAD